MKNFLFIVLLVWTPAVSFATPYYYSATGNISIDGISQSVTGSVEISNTFSFSNRAGYDPMFKYEITSFSFTIGDSKNFSGNSGYLSQSFLTVPINPGYVGTLPASDWIPNSSGWLVPAERGWVMHNDNYTWLEGSSPGFSFYDSNGVAYSPLGDMNFGSLAPTILLYGEDLQTAGMHTPGTITLSQVPVPEPSTFLLLGNGLAGLIWFGRKRKVKNSR